MNKIKINIYWGGLAECTSAFNENQLVDWVTDGSGVVNFYVNNDALNVINHQTDKQKYIWLLESRDIIPDVYPYVDNNYQQLLEHCHGIFTCDKNLADKHENIYYSLSNAAPWVQDRRIHDKSKLVSMIASDKGWTPGHQKRLRFVEKFRNQVDFYGRGFNTIDRKEQGLADYMFSIAVENANYDTYFTEKLTDCFACGTIPVFYGSPRVTDYFNPDGIIWLTDDFDISTLTAELYHSKLEAIQDNLERACHLPTAEDFIAMNYFSDWLK